MTEQNSFTLINPDTGNLAFKLFETNNSLPFDSIQRLNFYSLIWIKEGSGELKADFTEYCFEKNTLLAFSPYQPFQITPRENLNTLVIHFHPDFFCIHKHHSEIACSGILFNNIYSPPFVTIDSTNAQTLDLICSQLKSEMQNPALAQYELLVSYLKIFLITTSRLKKEQQNEQTNGLTTNSEPFILQNLKNFIETNFKEKHSPSEYADLLHISPKALGKITKTHFNKTLTDLISERIIIEAKRELYLTNKSVKEIAYGLGYQDEHYFSRFFKNNATISPQSYREKVGHSKAVV